MSGKFKLGLDIHGVVDAMPEFFSFLTDSFVKNGGEVHLITGGHWDENFEKQLELAKQKFDIKFKEVVDDEKNPKIQSYINLKKIEMQQELLATETKSILTDSGLSEEEAKKDEYLQSILTDIQTKMTTSEKLAGEEKKKLDAKVEEKTDDKKDGESVEYKDGDKIKYNMKDGGENQGEIIGIEGDIVKIKTLILCFLK
mgnify:CR=1 FL=1